MMYPRVLIVLAVAAIIGCAARTQTTEAADASPDAGPPPNEILDGGPLDFERDADAGCEYSKYWRPVDRVRGCTLPIAEADALCIEDPATHKGLYWLCAFGPDGGMLVGEVTLPVRLGAPGWTFAPVGTAQILRIPPASPGDVAACGAAPDGGDGGSGWQPCPNP